MTGLVPHNKDLTALPTKHGAVPPASRGRYGGFATLTVGALGVVYGDIGTSPLYAIDQIFIGPAGVAPTPSENVLGGDLARHLDDHAHRRDQICTLGAARRQ